VIGTDAGGYCELEFGSFGDALGGQISGPEELGDHYFGVANSCSNLE
jgi:hypothetical protein